MKELLSHGLIHGQCLTVTGSTVAENLAGVPSLSDLGTQVCTRTYFTNQFYYNYFYYSKAKYCLLLISIICMYTVTHALQIISNVINCYFKVKYY